MSHTSTHALTHACSSPADRRARAHTHTHSLTHSLTHTHAYTHTHACANAHSHTHTHTSSRSPARYTLSMRRPCGSAHCAGTLRRRRCTERGSDRTNRQRKPDCEPAIASGRRSGCGGTAAAVHRRRAAADQRQRSAGHRLRVRAGPCARKRQEGERPVVGVERHCAQTFTASNISAASRSGLWLKAFDA